MKTKKLLRVGWTIIIILIAFATIFSLVGGGFLQ